MVVTEGKASASDEISVKTDFEDFEGIDFVDVDFDMPTDFVPSLITGSGFTASSPLGSVEALELLSFIVTDGVSLISSKSAGELRWPSFDLDFVVPFTLSFEAITSSSSVIATSRLFRVVLAVLSFIATSVVLKDRAFDLCFDVGMSETSLLVFVEEGVACSVFLGLPRFFTANSAPILLFLIRLNALLVFVMGKFNKLHQNAKSRVGTSRGGEICRSIIGSQRLFQEYDHH